MDAILCDELLQEVFRRLPPPCSSGVPLVSKRWLRLYRSSRTRLSLRLSPHNCESQNISSFLSHFPFLSFLSLTADSSPGGDFSAFSDHLLLSVSSSCPNLRHLHLSTGPVSLFPLLSLSTSCPQLTSLSIALPKPFSLRWLLLFQSLKDLSLEFGGKFHSSVEHTDTTVEDSDSEPQLEAIALSGIGHGDYGLDWLWRSCKKLRKLQLQSCESIGGGQSPSSFVRCLKGLQQVELRACRTIIDGILFKLSENSTSLKSLLLHDGCSREGLLYFITQSQCNLQKLDLRLPLDLKNNHLIAIAENFRGLSSLRLQNCCLVTGEGLRTISLAMSDKLEELALINCDVVERERGLLTTLGQNLRKLRKLDLSHNEMLCDKELISMLASCDQLRELKLRGCEELTKAAMVAMIRNCKDLESVDVLGCRGIEAEGVELFVLNSSKLRQVQVEESKLSDVARSWASYKLIEVGEYN